MNYAFISYGVQNREYANKLADKLKAEGFNIWIDNAELRSSDNWWQSIVVALRNCAAVIVVMTPQSAESRWVQREITLADKWQKKIFPVLLAGDNWELFVLTQYEDVRLPRGKFPNYGGKLPSSKFFDKLAQVVPRQATLGLAVDNISNQDITEMESSIADAVMNPPPPDIPPGRATVRAAFISGIFLLVVTVLTVFVGPLILDVIRDNRSQVVTQTAEALNTLNSFASQTVVALISTSTPIPTNTVTSNFTATPLNTPQPSPTGTPPPTLDVLPFLASPPASYPCDATIIYNRTGLLNVVRAGPSSTSSFRPPIQQGSAIRILSKDQETPDVFWYHIANMNNEELGWIALEYAELSENCPK